MSVWYYLKRIRELGLSESIQQGKALLRERAKPRAVHTYEQVFGSKLETEVPLLRQRLRETPGLWQSMREREQPRFFLRSDSFYREAVDRHFPEDKARILAAANQASERVFDLLGSGPVDLGKRAPAGHVLPWHVDFKSGYAWDPNLFYRDIRYGNQPGVDVKVPWELSRCQHFPIMGQAYTLTSDEKYPQEFVAQVEDWIVQNRHNYGVNWLCAMDVGLRAVNWIWGFFFFRRSAALSDVFLERFLVSLYEHAAYIRDNLEFRRATVHGKEIRLNSNHYLSNLIGLLYISLLFPELNLGHDTEFARKELEIELFEQTGDDGVDFEHSTFYHRLVSEIFLSSFYLLLLNDQRPAAPVVERLVRMATYTADCLRPDGTVPQVGDADNGRVHPLAIRSMEDHRYLPLVAAEVFDRDDLRVVEKDIEALWWAGVVPTKPAVPRPHSVSYRGNSFTIMKGRTAQVFITAATVGMHGMGSHSHNDHLSFEYWCDGRSWIVDTGTYLYTPDRESRNYFRSTCAHNTVLIDGIEINPFREDHLFQLPDKASVTVHRWETTPTADVFDAEHTGYADLPAGRVTHRRRFDFNRETGLLEIRDSFDGDGAHTFDWFFHLSPEVTAANDGDGFQLRIHDERLKLQFVDGHAQCQNSEGWYSPSYGIRQKIQVIRGTLTRTVPFSVSIRIERLNAADPRH